MFDLYCNVQSIFAMFWCFFTITFNPFPAMPSCLNAFYQWSTDRTMFIAFTLTWKQGIFGEKVSKWSFFNLRFKFYLIVEKLAKCYNSHFGTNNVFLTEDRWKNELKVQFLIKGVCVLGALDNGPGWHQLHERPACEEHNLEVFHVSIPCQK